MPLASTAREHSRRSGHVAPIRGGSSAAIGGQPVVAVVAHGVYRSGADRGAHGAVRLVQVRTVRQAAGAEKGLELTEAAIELPSRAGSERQGPDAGGVRDVAASRTSEREETRACRRVPAFVRAGAHRADALAELRLERVEQARLADP